MNIYTNNESKCEVALEGLYEVLDPEIGLNIVDLGLIYQIDFDESNQHIELTMTLTTQFCPMGDSIVSDTKKSLQKSFPNWEIKVNLRSEERRVGKEGRARCEETNEDKTNTQ